MITKPIIKISVKELDKFYKKINQNKKFKVKNILLWEINAYYLKLTNRNKFDLASKLSNSVENSCNLKTINTDVIEIFNLLIFLINPVNFQDRYI